MNEQYEMNWESEIEKTPSQRINCSTLFLLVLLREYGYGNVFFNKNGDFRASNDERRILRMVPMQSHFHLILKLSLLRDFYAYPLDDIEIKVLNFANSF